MIGSVVWPIGAGALLDAMAEQDREVGDPELDRASALVGPGRAILIDGNDVRIVADPAVAVALLGAAAHGLSLDELLERAEEASRSWPRIAMVYGVDAPAEAPAARGEP